MRRRAFLTAVSGGIGISVAGCIDKSASEGDAPSITESSFEMVQAAETPEAPSVTNVDAEWPVAEVTIEGTVTVNNGCTVLTVESGPKIIEDGYTVKVVLGTREEGELCTQALTDIGYRLVVSYENACPNSVLVKHPGQIADELALNCL